MIITFPENLLGVEFYIPVTNEHCIVVARTKDTISYKVVGADPIHTFHEAYFRQHCMCVNVPQTLTPLVPDYFWMKPGVKAHLRGGRYVEIKSLPMLYKNDDGTPSGNYCVTVADVENLSGMWWHEDCESFAQHTHKAPAVQSPDLTGTTFQHLTEEFDAVTFTVTGRSTSGIGNDLWYCKGNNRTCTLPGDYIRARATCCWTVDYTKLAAALGKLITEKQRQYGNSVTKSAEILKLLYPQGVAVHQYGDVLLVVRVLDKLSRISQRGADGKDNESPWQDIGGYGLLGWQKDK